MKRRIPPMLFIITGATWCSACVLRVALSCATIFFCVWQFSPRQNRSFPINFSPISSGFPRRPSLSIGLTRHIFTQKTRSCRSKTLTQNVLLGRVRISPSTIMSDLQPIREGVWRPVGLHRQNPAWSREIWHLQNQTTSGKRPFLFAPPGTEKQGQSHEPHFSFLFPLWWLVPQATIFLSPPAMTCLMVPIT